MKVGPSPWVAWSLHMAHRIFQAGQVPHGPPASPAFTQPRGWSSADVRVEGGLPHLPLFPRNEHVLVAAPALLGRAVDAAAGVDDVTDKVPVGRVGRGHNREIQGQFQELLHSLQDQVSGTKGQRTASAGARALPKDMDRRGRDVDCGLCSPAAVPSPR